MSNQTNDLYHHHITCKTVMNIFLITIMSPSGGHLT